MSPDPAAPTQATRALSAFLDELDRLPERQLAAVFPLVVAMFATRIQGMPAPLQVHVDKLIAELGWQDGMSDDERGERAQAWMKGRGIEPWVWRKLLVAMHHDPDALRDVARRLSGVPTTTNVLERKAPPPPGTVGAGPFARFDLKK